MGRCARQSAWPSAQTCPENSAAAPFPPPPLAAGSYGPSGGVASPGGWPRRTARTPLRPRVVKPVLSRRAPGTGVVERDGHKLGADSCLTRNVLRTSGRRRPGRRKVAGVQHVHSLGCPSQGAPTVTPCGEVGPAGVVRMFGAGRPAAHGDGGKHVDLGGGVESLMQPMKSASARLLRRLSWRRVCEDEEVGARTVGQVHPRWGMNVRPARRTRYSL
jgi:hypothetical protein